MRKKLLCAMLATIMMLGATGCDLGKKPDKPEVPKKTIKEEETNQKFKEINGKMEVYLPIHYVYSGTQEGKKTGYEVYFTYDNRGLLLEKEFYNVITKKAFEMGSPDSYRYDKEYQMVSAVYNVGEKWN